MRIAILGYGKMGKAIEKIAEKRGHEIGAVFNSSDYKAADIASCDVAIEFSNPEAAAGNILKCFEADVPVVVGTTAWYDKYDELAAKAKAENKGLFTATNFSIGVNILFHINERLAEIMDQFPEYAVSMNETHHVHKKDHPSGTAVTLAEGILKHLDRKKEYVGQLEGQVTEVDTFDLQIISKREDEVPGFHEICYKSEIDEIKISHNALNRKGFAIGSVVAAEWMKGKKGVYGMTDLLKF